MLTINRKTQAALYFRGGFSSIFALLLYILVGNNAVANQIQLGYLQIKQIEPDLTNRFESTVDVSSTDTVLSYQVMWKQPANSNVSPLSIQFSDGIDITHKAAAVISNGAIIENFTLITRKSLTQPITGPGLTGQSITIVNLEKTNVEVMLKYSNGQDNYSVRVTPDSPSYTFIESPSPWQTIQSYTVFGIEHILEGYDHLLFVLCLLLIAATIRKLLWAITGFTLAHSITLVLSTLNIVQLPIVVVEAVIALSIVFLATEIAKHNNKSLSYRYPVAVSSSFGLLHGFGFASVLLELGLPQHDQLLALGFFNIGVEIGQLLFIGAVLLLMSALKKMLNMRKYEKVNAYIIGTIASMWLIERVLQF